MFNVAIYSRKSVFTEKGDSIENQIELCKNYCNSYLDSNANLNFVLYQDEGFSGKNTNRPEFQNMIRDIKEKKINVLICYRLDRISRNVADFSSTLELLQKYKVNFISIKERFDTSTPLGRAMIYIASVFAQLERETIAERVKDNMIQLAKSGQWLGGNLPYGFNSDKKTYLSNDFKEKTLSLLIPNEKELTIVNFIFSYYLKTHSIREVTRQLNLNCIIGKHGGKIDITCVRRILRNPLYVKSDKSSHEYLLTKGINVFGEYNGNGYITYNKNNHNQIKSNKRDFIVAVSNHKGIIPSNQWLKVQFQLDDNKKKLSRIGTGKNHSLLTGILRCKKCGSNMVIKFSGKNKDNIPYEYYVCADKQNKFKNKCNSSNIRVDILDDLISSKLKVYNKELLLKTLKKSLTCLKNNFENDSIINIKNEIKEKEIFIDNLVKELEKSDSQTVKSKLMNEINLLDKKIQYLKTQLNTIKYNTPLDSNNSTNIYCLINSLKQFNKTIDYIKDVNQKRFLIQSLVKYATWDSDTSTVEITLNNNILTQISSSCKSLDSSLYTSKR